jgi:hypothetical protein
MTVTVDITGRIEQKHSDSVKSALLVLDENPDEDLILKINSSGGSPSVGIDIFNMLGKYRSRTTAVALDKCMSAAVLIYVAADHRITNVNSEFMIHPTKWTVYGLAGFMKNFKGFINGVETGDALMTSSSLATLQSLVSESLESINNIELQTTAILKERTKLTDKQLIARVQLDIDQLFNSTESILVGISTN